MERHLQLDSQRATGWGAFKTIVGPDKQDWGNTDYYAYLWGQWTFVNPEAVNINVFTTTGIDYVNNSNLVEEAIDMIETDRADSIYICTTPDYNMLLILHLILQLTLFTHKKLPKT